MRAVVQRVSSANVTVDGRVTGQIDRGLVVLLGVEKDDTDHDTRYLAEKTAGLRIFADQHGKMNRSVVDIGGSVLVISQFTLLGDCRKGRRPSFISAADPGPGRQQYESYCQAVASHGLPVAQGQFGAQMDVALVNDGPVTLLLDSRRLF